MGSREHNSLYYVKIKVKFDLIKWLQSSNQSGSAVFVPYVF